MAKKKKKRVVTPARHGTGRPGARAEGSTTTDTADESASAPPATSQRAEARAPARTGPSAGALNRQARKEQARRERERLRRRARRRRLLRIGGAVLAGALAVAGLSAYLVTRPNPAEAAGCGGVQDVPLFGGTEAQDQSHVGVQGGPDRIPPLSQYPSVPPSSGPHSGAGTLPAGVYDQPPELDLAIHSLEHGAVIVWYHPDRADREGLREMRDFFRQPENQEEVILAPYQYREEGEAGRLPQGRQMALVSWHRVQLCQRADLAAAREFIKNHRNSAEAPESQAGI